VTVDGKAAKHQGHRLRRRKIVILPQSQRRKTRPLRPEAMELDIVFEDEHLIVIKQAGRPGGPSGRRQLVRHLAQRPAAPLPAAVGVPRAGIVHRLDKDTSGLMVVGKTLPAQTDLVRQLQARTVKREYFAVVWGTPRISGTIDASMGRHPKDRIKMAVSTAMGSKPAITHYQRWQRQSGRGPSGQPGAMPLETGRTHQIRVHMMSHLGFPLVGDTTYGKQHLTDYFPRQALQARRLGLVHPATGEQCEWIGAAGR
jgi:23S rRNA pseudouridine1911/1915/1917 synthase